MTIDNASNLGIIFDKEMNHKSHVSSICKSNFYHIKNLFTNRNTQNEKSANIATHALITSRLDYRNLLLNGSLILKSTNYKWYKMQWNMFL